MGANVKTWLIGAVLAAAVACGGAADDSAPGAAANDSTPDELNGFSIYLTEAWQTDFSNASVHRSEFEHILAKGVIPALFEPKFLSVPEVEFLEEREPVIAFQYEGEARAYPLQILMWHEIVNDVVGDRPVLITFCPLCNTAIAFDREVDGREFAFSVSGFLRHSDLVMFDDQTESW